MRCSPNRFFGVWLRGLLFVTIGLLTMPCSLSQLVLAVPDPSIEAYTDFSGEGISFMDFNQDGWDDLTITDPSGDLRFYVGGPDGLSLVDLGIHRAAGRPMSMMWIDIDNDGDRDFLHSSAMIISNFSGPSFGSRSQVWIKEESGYVDRTVEWGFDVLDNLASTGMAFSDMDLDGDLDVIVPVYSLPCQGIWQAGNLLLANEDFTFVDISVQSSIADDIAPSFQGAWMHLNGDSLIDLMVINDAGVGVLCEPAFENKAYLNNGDGTFAEASESLGLNVSMSSMTLSIGDPDGDGEEEFYISNQEIDSQYPYEQTTGAYFDRNDSGIFVECSSELGLDTERWSWGGVWIDIDSDGWEDLMVSTSPYVLQGDSYDESQDNYLFKHPGSALEPVSPFSDAIGEWEGGDALLYNMARGDLDGDRRPDVIGIGPTQYAQIWMNASLVSQPDHRVLTVGVCGSFSNSEAIGTRIVLHAQGHPQMRTLRAGEDLYVQHSATQFFGLGTAQTADSLELFWPNGARTVVYDLVADSAYQFVESQEDIGISLGQTLSGDSVELLLSAPPKWTSLTMNGQPVDSTVVVVLNGQETSFEWSWLNGLFSVKRDVDWSALDSNDQGCTVSIADNYNPQAVTDDGSCTYHGLCGEGTAWSLALQQCVLENVSCPEDVTGDGIVGVEDILELLGMFGEACAPD
jgi:hypothetical protein